MADEEHGGVVVQRVAHMPDDIVAQAIQRTIRILAVEQAATALKGVENS